MNNIEYQFSDIYLLHKKSIADSRTIDCNCTVKFGKYTFATPIIPANMASVVNDYTCEYLAKRNWFYIHHRFGTDLLKFTEDMHKKSLYASISVGVNNDSYNLLKVMKLNNIISEYITIDIANGFSNKSEKMIKYIKDTFTDTFLIVGNCATQDSIVQMEDWGADAIKVGIANGNVCTTYNATGFGRPQFSTVLECAKIAKKPIISDGGCREIGDFNKAFVAGATMVMAGGMFAGFDESAGDIINFNNENYKLYFGSASYNNKLHRKNVEGTCKLIPYKGSIQPFLDDIEDGIKSGISYAGGKTLEAFNDVKWVVKHK